MTEALIGSLLSQDLPALPQRSPATVDGEEHYTVGMAISGIMFDLRQPNPDHVRLVDIMFGMSRIPRYNGATLTYHAWTVGNHILICDTAYLLLCHAHGAAPDPELRAALFFHDAAETFTGDMVTPLKKAMKKHGHFGVFGEVTDAIDAATATRFGLKPFAHATIKAIDTLAYDIERIWHRPLYRDSPASPAAPSRTAVLFAARPEMQALREPLTGAEQWERLRSLALEIGERMACRQMEAEAIEAHNPYLDWLDQATAPVSETGSDALKPAV